jgi:photosystem II stability/assembly factor-like uncharacterized protein
MHGPGPKTRGMKQSLRVFLFGIAFIAFILFTYLAFFRPNFPAPGSSRGEIFAASWWLRPIEFNVAGRVSHVDAGVDFTCISGLPDGREIWIGGSKGVIIHSQDYGRTWQQLPTVNAPPVTSSPAPARTPAPQKKASLDSSLPLRRIAQSEQDEWIRVGMDEKMPKKSPPPEQTPKKSPPPQNYPAQKQYQTPPPATTSPAEIEPSPTIAPTSGVLQSNDIVDLALVDSSVAYALTAVGELLATSDAGMSWRLISPISPYARPMRRIRFSDEKYGVALRDGGVYSTADGAETWLMSSSVEAKDFVLKDSLIYAVGSFNGVAVFDPKKGYRRSDSPETEGLTDISGLGPGIEAKFNRIAVTPSGSLFACGDGGLVARFLFREIVESRALNTGQSANFNAIFFASDNLGWVAGDGVLLATRDGGDHWENQSTGVNSSLKAIHFFDESRGVAAGKNGTVIGTSNGGRDWNSLVAGTDATTAGRGHGWLPAPWYFATLLLLLGLVRLIPEEKQPAPQEGIGQLLVSDEPIETSDRDFLGFKQVALGLSNYLRNNATNPPLTIAITGEWGMGKSSLMNLLNADLRHYKFKPVWFNAWHHQTEESLLAALLENVRTQAIPSIFTPEGIVFRTKLLWARAQRNLFAFVVVVGLAMFGITYFAVDSHRLTQPPAALLKFVSNPGETIEGLKLRGFEVGKTVLALGATLGALLTFLKGFRAFGVDPSNLLASKSNTSKAKDLRAQTSFRYRFAHEFREVAASLNPLTMVLFVDDLDRCRPEQVYDMLEAINFLVSCGDCFVVMGFARRRVERCVGLVFEKVAAERPDVEGEQPLTDLEKRERFARMYLEKLINIEVPVPPGQPDQIRSLLINKPGAVKEPRSIDVVAEKISKLGPHLLPIAGAFVAGALAIWCSLQLFPVSTSPLPTPSPLPMSTPAATPSASSTPASVSSETPRPSLTPSPTPVKAEIGSAKFTSGQTGNAPLWAILLVAAAILTPGVIRLSRRTGSVIEDSPAFITALERWFPFLITRTEMTPRSIKRFVNRLRYFAMMEGSFQAAPRWWERLARFFERKPAAKERDKRPSAPGTPEDLLVALATIHERHRAWFDADYETFRQKFSEAAADFGTGEGESWAYWSTAIQGMNKDVYEHFKKLVAGVEVR